MKRKWIVGAALASMLLTVPAVFAADDDDVMVFGGEYEEPKVAVRRQSEPAPAEPIEQPPIETPVEPAPIEEPSIETPPIEAEPIEQQPLVEEPIETQPIEQPPIETEPIETEPIEPQPIDTQPIETEPPQDEEIDIGDTLRFNPITGLQPSNQSDQPFNPLVNEPSDQNDQPFNPIVNEPTEPVDQPFNPIVNEPTEPVDQPFNPLVNEPTEPVEQPFNPIVNEPSEPIDTPLDQTVKEPEPELPFKDLTPSEPTVFEPKVNEPEPAVDEPFKPITPPATPVEEPKNEPKNEPSREQKKPVITRPAQPQGKQLKPRFIKLVSDDTFDYYLDKSSVQWQNVPYSSSEYMADVWVRMIERNGSDGDLPRDVRDYLAGQVDEVSEAASRGLIYNETDAKVLRTKRYFLEHYYIRPKTRQIQFLSELEVIGRPQNAISERAYDYKNWENLIPGSIETAIYYGVLDVIGKSKASSRGHMTATDMLEEYARISIR